MEIESVDRTNELELRLRAIRVNSEDTCAFWQKREDALAAMRRCFYCTHRLPEKSDESSGLCKFKQTRGDFVS